MLNLLQRVVGVQRHNGHAQHQSGEQVKQTDALEALAEAPGDARPGS